MLHPAEVGLSEHRNVNIQLFKQDDYKLLERFTILNMEICLT